MSDVVVVQKYFGERYKGLYRLIVVANVIQMSRLGKFSPEIREYVREWTGIDYTDRTIDRDLRFLVEMGLVIRTTKQGVGRFRWNHGKPSLLETDYMSLGERLQYFQMKEEKRQAAAQS